MKNFLFVSFFYFILFGAFGQANKKDAKLLLEVSGLSEKYQNVIDQFSDQLPEESRAEFKKDIQSYINKQINLEADMYASSFSQDEILKLIEFYKSPLGIKLIQKSNVINNIMLKEIEKNQSELQGILMKYFM